MSQPEVRPFDRMSGTDEEFAALTEIRNVYMAEANPDDPPSTVENTRNQMQNIPPVFEFHVWVAWAGSRAVGYATLGIPRLDTNQHLAQFEITVLPEFRRQGLATSFLELMTRLAKKENRTLLMSNAYDTVPPGEAFLEALGATVGLSLRRNDLLMTDLDRGLVRTWIERARERASGFELREFVGPYPEDELSRIAEMEEAGNGMPRDDLQMEDFHFTPEELRQMDEAMVASGNDRWTFVAVDTTTGRYAGWTDLQFNPTRPTVVDVGGTAVHKEYQNLGLGRWLKAAVMDKLARERPDVVRVRTGNAHSNAPMLKINDEMGFKPALTMNLWQVETEKAQEFVAKHTKTAV